MKILRIPASLLPVSTLTRNVVGMKILLPSSYTRIDTKRESRVSHQLLGLTALQSPQDTSNITGAAHQKGKRGPVPALYTAPPGVRQNPTDPQSLVPHHHRKGGERSQAYTVVLPHVRHLGSLRVID
ncbi:hypothetical protein AMTR_s00091p00118730 [Amborella trichopoda]|uniref:Uncharacterized protein n=1 Tax=Amborella trichopoda TaxID=13333 RepID=W1NTB0_AMBTC|nr:hypothetical protein AMTR_s00091p00118730 [Amborella trichopoda]